MSVREFLLWMLKWCIDNEAGPGADFKNPGRVSSFLLGHSSKDSKGHSKKLHPKYG